MKTGRIVIDPDDEVRGAVQLVFRLFEEERLRIWCGTALCPRRPAFPKRAYGGAWRGKLIWGRLDHGRVPRIIRNPYICRLLHLRSLPIGQDHHPRRARCTRGPRPDA